MELGERVLAHLSALLAFSPDDEDSTLDTSRAAASPVRLRVLGGSEPAPLPTREAHFTSPVLKVWRTETGFQLFSGDSSVALDSVGGTATVHVADTFWASPLPHRRELFLISMLMLLQPRRVHGLHAVGVVKSGAGALIVGDSGAGKTTTSLALIRTGWSYLSDDAVGLRESPARDVAEAMAFRRGFSCTREGWLALSTNTPAERDGYQLERDKWLIEMSDHVPGQQAYKCVPGMVAFPVVSNQATSSIRALSDTEGLLRLLPQSAGITSRRDYAQDHIALLGTLARQVRFYEFSAGRDVFDDPGRVSDLFMAAAGEGGR